MKKIFIILIILCPQLYASPGDICYVNLNKYSIENNLNLYKNIKNDLEGKKQYFGYFGGIYSFGFSVGDNSNDYFNDDDANDLFTFFMASRIRAFAGILFGISDIFYLGPEAGIEATLFSISMTNSISLYFPARFVLQFKLSNVSIDTFIGINNNVFIPLLNKKSYFLSLEYGARINIYNFIIYLGAENTFVQPDNIYYPMYLHFGLGWRYR